MYSGFDRSIDQDELLKANKNLFTQTLHDVLNNGGDNFHNDLQEFFTKDEGRVCLLSSLLSADTKKRLASYNQEYLQLIPQFYYYLELRNKVTAKAILQQVQDVNQKYLSLIKENIQSSIIWFNFTPELLNKFLSAFGSNWLELIIDQLAYSFCNHYFNGLPEQGYLANENAKQFYQAFFDGCNKDHNLVEEYLKVLRNQIPELEEFEDDSNMTSQVVKAFFYSKKEVEKAKFDYVITPQSLRHHPFLAMRKDIEKPVSGNEKSYLKDFMHDWLRGAIIFEDNLSLGNLKEIFLKDTGEKSIGNNGAFEDFCLNAFCERYGKDNIYYLMRHYNQFLFAFAAYATVPFTHPNSDKPFTMGEMSKTIKPVFIGDVIELHCIYEHKTLKSHLDIQTLEQRGLLQGIQPDLISDQDNENQSHIHFPGCYEWKFRLDSKTCETGFMFDVNSITASNLVLAQFANGTAAYGLRENLDQDLYADEPPINNHAYSFSAMVNCANKQQALRESKQLTLFHQTGEVFEKETLDYFAITETIGNPDHLGSVFYSYESAGDALMKRILKRDQVTESMVAILESSLERTYLTEEQCDNLKKHTKAALAKHNAETIEKCKSLIAGWESEAVKYLEKIMEDDDLDVERNIEIYLPLRLFQQIKSLKRIDGIKITGSKLDRIICLDERHVELQLPASNPALADLANLFNKLMPTYKIKETLELAQPMENYNPLLSNMVKATNKAAKIFENNLKNYCKERHPELRNTLYDVALLLAIPTAGLTFLAALVYSYATTGTLFFLSNPCPNRSNALKASFEDTGVVLRN